MEKYGFGGNHPVGDGSEQEGGHQFSGTWISERENEEESGHSYPENHPCHVILELVEQHVFIQAGIKQKSAIR